MYIREDLLNKIKEIFDIKEFTYVGTGKHFYNNNDMFIFNCDNEIIAIEIKNPNLFFFFLTKEDSECHGYFYTFMKRNFLLFKENETHLRVDGETTTFPAKAFDFTSELVLLVMEKYWKTPLEEDVFNA